MKRQKSGGNGAKRSFVFICRKNMQINKQPYKKQVLADLFWPESAYLLRKSDTAVVTRINSARSEFSLSAPVSIEIAGRGTRKARPAASVPSWDRL